MSFLRAKIVPGATKANIWMKLRLWRGLFACLALAACSAPPPPASTSSVVEARQILASPVVSTQSESLTPEDIRRVMNVSENEAYKIGPNDIIAVSVYMHPELSVPSPGGNSGINGVMVTGDGTISLPLINTINVGGLTPGQAADAIATAYKAYLNNPKVSVQIVGAQSLRYYLLGEFTEPGVKYPGHPLDLLDAMALGGSVDLKNADLYQAYVAQGNVKLPVDLHALLLQGDMTQNITLASGAAIVIPPSSSENAYVFGAVGKPGAVPFQGGSLSLLQALSVADLDLTNISSAKMAQIHLIRAHGTGADFMVINAALIMKGEALPFALEPGDIVFVPPTPVASWNAVLTMLLPTLNTISGVLNPFVSIKYLSQ